MGIVNGIRIVDQLVAGTMSGAQLETWLGTGINKAGFVQALNSRSQSRVLSESSAATTAVFASATALAALTASSVGLATFLTSSAGAASVAASGTAMAVIAASNVLLTAMINSSIAMTAVAANAVSKMVLYNSDNALNAVRSSAVAMAAMRAAAGYIVASNTPTESAVALTGPNAAGSYIMLGYSKNNALTQGLTLIATRRATSLVSNSVAAMTNAVSTLGRDADIALPVATPFTTTATAASGYVWYYGMLRCDV